jgi:hypothetical protein
VFNFRAFVRTAGLAAGIAALALGLFAGSAFAWYNCKDSGGKDHTSTVPASSSGPSGDSKKGDSGKDHGDKPTGGDHKPGGGEEKPSGGDHKPSGGEKKPGEESKPTPPSVGESTPVPPTVPVATGLLPAAPHPAAGVSPGPSPATPPAVTPPVVKGEIGTVKAPVVKGEIGTAWNGSGGQAPTVLAATEVAQASGQGGGLAQTGFDLLPVAILGGLALGGSGFFFRRFQGC